MEGNSRYMAQLESLLRWGGLTGTSFYFQLREHTWYIEMNSSSYSKNKSMLNTFVSSDDYLAFLYELLSHTHRYCAHKVWYIINMIIGETDDINRLKQQFLRLNNAMYNISSKYEEMMYNYTQLAIRYNNQEVCDHSAKHNRTHRRLHKQ